MGILFLAAGPTSAARQLENLDRGVVAVKTSAGVFVGWRVLGTESSSRSFNLYRDGSKLNATPITGATNYTDASGSANASYVVKSVVGGTEIDASLPVKPWAEQVKRIPLDVPAGGRSPDNVNFSYSPNDASAGDLDGDGDWDLVLKWDPSNSHDNSQSGYTGNVYLDGLTLEGTRLWRIDLGRNIRAGAHYTQFVVADFDGDGKAEIICKTAPGTKDGSGNFLSKGPAASDDDSKDYRTSAGFITSGPEYLTIFRGLDGKELATVNYVPGRDPANGWGKTSETTNRVDRFLATAAWLDGVKPSAVMQRGYYGRMAITAWDWDGATLKQRWYYNAPTSGSECFSQGNHNVVAADVDNDGRDEIIEGSCAVDENGKFMYRTGLGHGDAIHVGDLMPSRPGLEVWQVHEETGAAYGYEMHDAATGKILWGTKTGTDNGRGLAADIDASREGYEMWSSSGAGMYTAGGTQFSTSKGSINFRIYWDGDLQDELLDGIGSAPSAMKIEHWNGTGFDRILSSDTRSGSYTGINNNGTKSNPVLVADLLGDWREEMILRQDDNSALLLYTTIIPTTHRLYTLMHDPVYRNAISWQNTAYNQPPHLGFWLGAGVDKAPIPDITLVGGVPPVPRDCNGEENGKATVDSCGRCVGGSTGLVACSAWIEAEDFCSADGILETTNPGSFGGYLNLENAPDKGAIWAIKATSAGKVSLAFRYANGGTSDRPVLIAVNQSTAVPQQPFPTTAGWSDWTLSEASIPLNAGNNLVSIQSLTTDGAANLDRIGLVGTGLSRGECAPVSVQRKDSHLRRFGDQLDLEALGDLARLRFTARDLRGTAIVLRPQGAKLDLQSLPRGTWILEIRRDGSLLRKESFVRM
ncbi:MAG: pseudouridine synthase [Fibrobacteria bacterium]|nr:pseudouridine synthase [Fibrobacteria bacterium]